VGPRQSQRERLWQAQPAGAPLSASLSSLASAGSRSAVGRDGHCMDLRQHLSHRHPIGIGIMTIVIIGNSQFL